MADHDPIEDLTNLASLFDPRTDESRLGLGTESLANPRKTGNAKILGILNAILASRGDGNLNTQAEERGFSSPGSPLANAFIPTGMEVAGEGKQEGDNQLVSDLFKRLIEQMAASAPGE